MCSFGREDHPWYAIRVKSNRERVTAEALKARDVPVCFPVCHASKPHQGRTKVTDVPLFPGYLFSRFDVNKRLPILTIPGVVHIVSIGRTPQPVEESEMAAILSVMKSGIPARRHQFLPISQPVRVDHGPLTGVHGAILSHTKGQRLIISIGLLQRSIAVEVEPHWISAIDPKAAVRPAPEQHIRVDYVSTSSNHR